MKRVPRIPPAPWTNRDLPRAPLRLTLAVTPQRARVPPIGYGDGLPDPRSGQKTALPLSQR
jgi:hypothetical protein